MSWQATTWVVEHSQHKGSELLTLLMIANCANERGQNAFPSLQKLAKDTRMNERSVRRIIEKLETSGELQVERSSGRTSHRYMLPMVNVDKMSGLNVDISESNVDISSRNVDTAMSTDQSVDQSNKQYRADFWLKLQTNPAYTHVDLELERQKMELWCDANRRKLSYRFAVNWLNRIPKPKAPSRKVSDPEYQKELENRWRNQKTA